jgi:hypothetical protein
MIKNVTVGKVVLEQFARTMRNSVSPDVADTVTV